MLARMVSIYWPGDLPALASKNVGITGVSHHAWPFSPVSLNFLKIAILNSLSEMSHVSVSLELVPGASPNMVW